MKVDVYERAWMWIAAVLIVGFLGAIIVAAGASAIHPPSHVEVINPEAVYDDEEFGSPGVETLDDGSIRVTMVGEMFFFDPDEMVVPVNTPVTFRITSTDVIHGILIAGTNTNAMIIPGYVTEFTITFPKPGEYLMMCHEYCGTLHHEMVGALIVEEEGA
jgi:cytochrome c oxidase subunit 2